MDKSSEEIRRKKILDNAEARLRFIKEGLPWRRDEENRSETIAQSKESEAASKQGSSSQIKESANSLPLIQDPHSQSQNLKEFKTQELENKMKPNHSINISSEDFKSLTSFIAAELSSNSKLRSEGSGSSFLESREPSDLLLENKRDKSLPSDIQADDTLRTLRAFLRELSNERQDQKQKADQLNRNIWTRCFVMLCLGVLTRLAYTMHFSWLFNQVMFAPFLTGAVPVLVTVARDPPAPTGTVVQVLLMAGVRTAVLQRAFTVITILRTFLQLFSVYLISFVVTHHIALSY